jgi:hypothetical protein
MTVLSHSQPRWRLRALVAAMLIVAAATQALVQQSTKPADLDQLLAPIALYPDQLLSQMLLSAGDPDQIVKLRDWLRAHPDLKGTALQDEATRAEFEPSFVALAVFPQVVEQMASDRNRTAAVGKAFAADRKGVFASIQRLRSQAKASGALTSTPQQTVSTTATSSGQQVIVIEPANPQVVYVPQYNPTVVYTQPTTTTVVVQEDDDDADAAVAGLIGFTAGIAIGAAIDNDYYYGPYGMGGGFYMYNDAWDDWYDHREDAREDWMDHREDLADERGDRAEERGDRAGTRQEQRTDRTSTRQEQRTDRTGTRQDTASTARASGTSANTARTNAAKTSTAKTSTATTNTARTNTPKTNTATTRTAPERSGTRSDAFSGYSSGSSQRAASQRGQRSRSSSGRQGGGGGGRRR